MSAESTDLRRSERGFWWWVFAILTPIGVFSGPIAIANMFADLIEWKDWIGSVVHFWDDNVTRPIKVILDFITSAFGLPPVPRWFADYMALGFIFLSTSIRAQLLIPTPENPVADSAPSSAPFRVWHGFWLGIVWMFSMLAWPLLFLFSLVLAPLVLLLARWSFESDSWPVVLFGFYLQSVAASAFGQAFLATASFAIFGMLCAINAFLG